MITYLKVHKTAEQYLKNGKEFLKAAELCLGPKDENGGYQVLGALPAPCCVNGAFACEMFFKAAYVFNREQYPHDHKLNHLFLEAPDDYKNLIKKYAFSSELTLDEFLKRFNNYFVDTRYYVEKEIAAKFDILGIYTLAFNICSATEYYIKSNVGGCNGEIG